MTTREMPRLEFSSRNRCSTLRTHRAVLGFTLIELAIAIAIIGLLLGALLVPLATHSNAGKNRATERDLKEIKEALIGFGISTGRLPCPDTTGNGLENLTGALAPPPATPPDCVALEGNLPWLTLGVVAVDAWDQRFRYRVNQQFAYPVYTGQPPDANYMDLTDIGDTVVVTRGAAKSLLVETQAAAAVVYSVGIDGLGGTNLDGNTLALPEGRDQRSNTDGVYASGTTTGADGSADVTDSGADFVTAGVQVGHIVFNLTDGSQSLVTAVAATTLTVGGTVDGTDNDFDTGDRYAVSPFVNRPYTRPTPGCNDNPAFGGPLCGFDDLMITLPTAVLIGRLIEANLLP